MSVQNLALFLLAAILVTLSPGPDILTVIARSMAQGTWAGMVATLGFATGLIVHTTIAATGLALVLRGSPTAFRTIQFLGAAYLLYLAVRMFVGREPLMADRPAERQRALGQVYGQSVLMNVLNPKVTLFFVAFLARFVEPGSGVPVWMQMVVLGGLFAASTILCFGTCALVAGRLTGFVRRHPRAGRPMRVATGVVFVVVAASIVAT